MKLRALGQEGSVVEVDEEASTGQGTVCTAPGSGRAWHTVLRSSPQAGLLDGRVAEAAPRKRPHLQVQSVLYLTQCSLRSTSQAFPSLLIPWRSLFDHFQW